MSYASSTVPFMPAAGFLFGFLFGFLCLGCGNTKKSARRQTVNRENGDSRKGDMQRVLSSMQVELSPWSLVDQAEAETDGRAERRDRRGSRGSF